MEGDFEGDFAYNDIEDLVLDIDKYECDWIESNLKKEVTSFLQRLISYRLQKETSNSLVLQSVFDIPRGKEFHRYNIIKCQDEYYYVKVMVYTKETLSSDTKYVSDDWYRCDQFDGLKKFLRDEKLIS